MKLRSSSQRERKMYPWERIGIAFRIALGFILPILVSVYALYSVSGSYSETSEFGERIQRMWHSSHVTDSKALLTLTKVRLHTQPVAVDQQANTFRILRSEVQDFHLDTEQSKKVVSRIAMESGLPLSQAIGKNYSALDGRHQQLTQLVEQYIDANTKRNTELTDSLRSQIDRSATEMESLMGRMRAAKDLFELDVIEKMKAGEEHTKEVLTRFMVMVLLIGVAAAVVVTGSISLPIRRIRDRVKDIATGDGDLTKRVYTRSGGEMMELASWMNLFLEKTQNVIATISNASIVVRQTTEQVGNFTQRTTVAASGISKAMMEQSMNLDECTNSLGSIDDLIQSSGDSTRQAASLSKIAMDRALQGGASVHETIEAMEKIEESAKKIESLVYSINEIASQTNLLAINAAIEATKAGEHGKGFAVVAEEVRKLAERARKLTGEVTSLMGESSVRVKAGVNLAKGAGFSLDGIIKDVEAVASLIQRIAASASKQTQSSSIVLEFMQKVSATVRTNLTEMQEVTKATELTSLEVAKLDALVNQLNMVVGAVPAAGRRVYGPGHTGAFLGRFHGPVPAGSISGG